MKLPTKIASAVTGVLAITLLVSPAIAEAHVLKEDNGISSVMHIDPDDNPVAGVKTTLDFDFGNTSGDFSITNYHIKATLTENNKVVETTTVNSAYFGSTTQSIATVMFPRVDVYQLNITGSARNKSMPSFAVSYLIRVASSINGTHNSQGNSSVVILLSATSLILLVMTAVYVIYEGKRYANTSNKKQAKEKVI